MITIKDAIKNFIYKLLYIIIGCFTITMINWLIVRFVATYCYPSGLFGPVISLFTIGSPICHTLTLLQNRLTEQYVLIITSIVTLIIANCNITFTNDT